MGCSSSGNVGGLPGESVPINQHPQDPPRSASSPSSPSKPREPTSPSKAIRERDEPESVAPPAGFGSEGSRGVRQEEFVRKVSWGENQQVPISPKRAPTSPLRHGATARGEIDFDAAIEQESPTGGVRIDFDAGGEVVTKVFKHKPLGFTFDKQIPMIVDHVVAHGVAEEMGIQTGWVVARIGDMELEGRNFLDVFHHLQDKVGTLPKKPKKAIGGLGANQFQSNSKYSIQSLTSSNGCGSMRLFAEPCQTLIFCDWDETLFPTSEITDRWKLPYRDGDPPPNPSAEQRAALSEWQSALEGFLEQALECGLRCTIVTAAKKGWVTTCIDRFAPGLKPLFDNENLRVVYATELVRHGDLTRAKCVGMTQEAESFYSQYNNQSWKNVISIGDMPIERDALRRMSFERSGTSTKERLRTKTVLLPTEPKISEMTLRLKFDCAMLPMLTRFDGDFDIDLKTAKKEPLDSFADSLDLPYLSEIAFPAHAWGRGELPEEQEVTKALTDLYMQVDGIPADGCGEENEGTDGGAPRKLDSIKSGVVFE